MQFPAWVLQILDPSGSGRCVGEDYLYARDAYFPERLDDTTNKMYPMDHETLPHPTIVKKMQTFLEVEVKMAPIPQPTSSQYRSPQLNTSPNVRKDKAAEKRKRVVPTKRFRPSTVSRPSKAASHPSATTSKASTSDRSQVQGETSDSRPPPL